MKKTICAALLTLCLLASLLPAPALAAQPPAWDGTVAEAFAGGSGTEKNPYKIADGAQLALLAQLVNEGNEDYNAAYYELTADIDLAGGGDRQWTPIGFYDGSLNETPFSGFFNGNGHWIRGLYVNETGSRVGLFGYVRNGTVANLSVSGSVSGWREVGGVAGCCVTGGLSDAGITGCVNYATVSGNYAVGGVVGCNQTISAKDKMATVSYCVNAGPVYGKFDGVGGVVGSNETSGGTSRVIRCMNAGRVEGGGRYIGGVVGDNYADRRGSALVTNCYNTGVVTWLKKSGDVSNNGKQIGGVAGRNYASFSGVTTGAYPSASVQSCYNVGPVDGRERVGGVVGYTSHSGGTIPKATVRGCRFLQTASVNAGLPPVFEGNGTASDNAALSVQAFSDWSQFKGWDDTIWTMEKNLNDQLSSVTVRPVLTGLEEPDPAAAGEIPVMGVSLDRTEWTLRLGDWNRLKATVQPVNATDQTVTWRSSDPNLVTVDDKGRIDAVAVGTAEITASAGDASAVCVVTVVRAILEDLYCYEEDGRIIADAWAEGRDEDSLVIAAYGPGGVFLGAKLRPVYLGGSYAVVPEGAEIVRAFVVDENGRPLTSSLEEAVPEPEE